MIHQTVIKFVLHQGWGDFKDLWLMKYELDKSYNGCLEKGDIKWVEVPEATDARDIIPFMRIPRWLDVQMLIDTLSENLQLPPTKQVEVDAELKATKYHLEDMRRIALKVKI